MILLEFISFLIFVIFLLTIKLTLRLFEIINMISKITLGINLYKPGQSLLLYGQAIQTDF